MSTAKISRHWRASLLVLTGFAVWRSSVWAAPVDVDERSYNQFRTGVNSAEMTLTPAVVNSTANRFHRRFVLPVDGKIEGSPLYAANVSIGGGTHNVIYVGTMHNTVFAFDADTGTLLSARWLGNSVVGGDLSGLKPQTIHSEWGIASTPVLDRGNNVLWVVRWGYESGTLGPTFRLFALNPSDLSQDRYGSVRIDGYDINGTGFNRYLQMQRSGLALVKKPTGEQAVVVAFGGGEGQGSPAGWVIAFDTAKIASGNPVADAWCSTPNNSMGSGGGGGVWMANAAPAVDTNGDIYVVTGNGPYNPEFAHDQLGESVVKLTWTPGAQSSLHTSDWFTPFLDIDRDNFHKDQDLAAGGVVTLPDGPGVIVGGKDGILYNVNRAGMGHRDFTKLIDPPFVATFDYQPWNGKTSLFDDLNQITSTDPFTIGHVDGGRTPHIHGTAVYFNHQLFVNGENNVVRVFQQTSGHFGATPIARGTATASWGTPSPGGMPGGMLSLSASGTSNGILWVNEAYGNLSGDPAANVAPTPNILRAYDVSTATSGTLRSIWDSETEPNDRVGAATKFAPPLIANGRVYQATYDNQVIVYGLGAASPTPTRDIRRTVIFIYADAIPGQDMFMRGGAKGGAPIRIRHRTWLNPHTNTYRWGDTYLDWGGGEAGQAQPTGGLGGGSPAEWTTNLAQGQGQPFVWTRGFGIADENTFGMHYWMLDVDMDCEQAFADGQGRRWFEIKAFMITNLMTQVAPSPGWEADVTQASNPAPPYASGNHMGQCGMVNVFVANYAKVPAGLDPNSARFLTPAYTFPAPLDNRDTGNPAITGTPCVAPQAEKRCLGNLAQTCQTVGAGSFFRTVQDCGSISSGGNFVQMCQQSTGQCCIPRFGNTCQ
jgi:hypothetical protein